MAVEFKTQRLYDAVGGAGAADVRRVEYVPGRQTHLFRIQTVGYTGLVDIQGAFNVPNGATQTWENVPYLRRAAGTASYSVASAAQISFVASTAVAMVMTVEPRELMRLSVDPGAGNTGTITIDVLGVEDNAGTLAQTSNSVVGGGAVTIADGADVAEGAIADAAETDPTASATVVSILKGLLTFLAPPGPPITGHKAVAVVGTQVRLVAVSTPCRGVILTGDVANTGYIYAGASNVDSATFLGTAIAAKQTVGIPIDDATDLWLDCTVNGEGCGFNIIPL